MNTSSSCRRLPVTVAFTAIGCAADAVNPAGGGPAEDTFMSFEEFEVTVYREANTGIYIVKRRYSD